MNVCFECGVGSTPGMPLELVDDRPGTNCGGTTVYACGPHASLYIGDSAGLQLLARVRRA